MVGISRGIDRDSTIEMLERLRVFTGTAHNTAPCRFDVAQCKIMIRELECSLSMGEQPQCLVFQAFLEKKPCLMDLNHRSEHGIFARLLCQLARRDNLQNGRLVFTFLSCALFLSRNERGPAVALLPYRSPSSTQNQASQSPCRVPRQTAPGIPPPSVSEDSRSAAACAGIRLGIRSGANREDDSRGIQRQPIAQSIEATR